MGFCQICIYVIGYEKTSLVAQKLKLDFISAVESTKHTDYSNVLAVFIAHSFAEL